MITKKYSRLLMASKYKIEEGDYSFIKNRTSYESKELAAKTLIQRYKYGLSMKGLLFVIN